MGQSKNKKIKEHKNCHNLSQSLCSDLDIKTNTQETRMMKVVPRKSNKLEITCNFIITSIGVFRKCCHEVKRKNNLVKEMPN